jgi:hypothetical protein
MNTFWYLVAIFLGVFVVHGLIKLAVCDAIKEATSGQAHTLETISKQLYEINDKLHYLK